MDARLALPDDLLAIEGLLRSVDYPSLPADVMPALKRMKNICIWHAGQMIGWVGVRIMCGNLGVFSWAVAKEWQKRWLSRGLLKKLVYVIFEGMNVGTLLIEQFGEAGMRLAESFGFVPLLDTHGKQVGFQANRAQIERKLRMNE